MSHLIRHGFTRWTAALALLATAALGATVTQAQSTDGPKKPTANNGIRVYLSKACHNGAGSSGCRPNKGCFDYNENDGSGVIATAAARHLTLRGYVVKIGTGTREANIRDSNAFGAQIHIPIHSNAGNSDCESTNPANGGTLVLHHSGRYNDQLAEIMVAEVGARSPGTNDRTEVSTKLAEINATNAHVAYLEAAYHTFGRDVEFLRNPNGWAWTIARAVDRCRGFPRNGPTPTRTKECSW